MEAQLNGCTSAIVALVGMEILVDDLVKDINASVAVHPALYDEAVPRLEILDHVREVIQNCYALHDGQAVLVKYAALPGRRAGKAYIDQILCEARPVAAHPNIHPLFREEFSKAIELLESVDLPQ